MFRNLFGGDQDIKSHIRPMSMGEQGKVPGSTGRKESW